MPDDDLPVRLERFVAGRIDGADRVRVTWLERSTEGFSRETFAFDVEVARNGGTERRGRVLAPPSATRLLPRRPVPPAGQTPRRQEAIVAVAHSILVIAYHLLRGGQSYRELGGG